MRPTTRVIATVKADARFGHEGMNLLRLGGLSVGKLPLWFRRIVEHDFSGRFDADWFDHYSKDGNALVVEPYGLTHDSLRDLLALRRPLQIERHHLRDEPALSHQNARDFPDPQRRSESRVNTAPVPHLTSRKEATFSTEDLPFAAYVHASRKLHFLTCQVSGNDRVAFVFADPNNEGDQLHLNFESGAECPAAAFYDSIRHLRRVMDRTRTRSIEQNEHHSHRR